MKGLIRHNFYSAQGNFMVCIVVLVATLIAMTLFRIPLLLHFCLMLSVLLCPITTGTVTQTAATSKWSKMELTLPVTRGDIIKSKYLSYLLMALVGLVIAAAGILLATMTNPDAQITAYIPSVLISTSICMITGAVYFPLVYKLGEDKGESLIIIACFCSAVVVGAINMGIGSVFSSIPTMSRAAALTATCAIVLFGSERMTERIYQKREFS